jgi:arylsulfatase A-like enzyme
MQSSASGSRTVLSLILWLLAGALACAAADVHLLFRASNGQATPQLAGLVFRVYAALGLFAGAGAAMASAAVPRGSRGREALWSVGMVGWPLGFTLAYANIVHLPSITHPITWGTNLLIVGLAAGTTWLVWRSSLPGWALRSPYSAVGIAALAVVFPFALAAAEREPATVRAVPRANATGPNVLLVVVDTLRFDRTGAAGGAASKTPALDRLAQEGTSFTMTYAQASWTKPSVASLVTSLYPGTHQANLRRDQLGESLTTLPEAMAALGHRTAVFSGNPWISPAFGFDQGVEFFFEAERETFSRFVVLWRILKTLERALGVKHASQVLASLEERYGVRSPHRTNCERDRALVNAFRAWLPEVQERPWFAYVHLMSPHIPYEPPSIASNFATADQVELLQTSSALSEERHRELLELYDGAVAHGDTVLADILAHLEASGSLDRTVVVVTADHGEEFHEHGRWGHGKSLYDEVVRVPLVLRGPGIRTNARENRPTMLVDVMPTLVRLAGGQPDGTWEGEDLLALSPERTAYAELIREGGLESSMVYQRPYKLIEVVDALGAAPRVEFYDLASDPGERVSRDRPETGPWRAAKNAIRERAISKRGREQRLEQLDEAAEERLRALGYLN